MASTKIYRERIKSIRNIRQITKAMEMIASIKMQKAIKDITKARNYIHEAWDVLKKITFSTLPEDHILLQPKNANTTAVILITSNRGLCGAYNSEVIKKFTSYLKNENIKNCDVIAIGKSGSKFVSGSHVANLITEFESFENNFNYQDILPIYKLVFNEYLNNKYERVVIIYSQFISSIKQVPITKQILPIIENNILEVSQEQKQKPENNIDFQFEPDASKVLETVLKQTIRTQIYGAILEANASEQSARMLAMKNATDNAQDLISELTLIYNSIRQSSVTSEISEITSAAEAMK